MDLKTSNMEREHVVLNSKRQAVILGKKISRASLSIRVGKLAMPSPSCWASSISIAIGGYWGGGGVGRDATGVPPCASPRPLTAHLGLKATFGGTFAEGVWCASKGKPGFTTLQVKYRPRGGPSRRMLRSQSRRRGMKDGKIWSPRTESPTALGE